MRFAKLIAVSKKSTSADESGHGSPAAGNGAVMPYSSSSNGSARTIEAAKSRTGRGGSKYVAPAKDKDEARELDSMALLREAWEAAQKDKAAMARLDDLGKKPGLTPRALISLAVVKLMKAPELMASLHPEERVQRVLRVAQGLPANPPQQPCTRIRTIEQPGLIHQLLEPVLEKDATING